MPENFPVYTLGGIVALVIMMTSLVWLRFSQTLALLKFSMTRKILIRVAIAFVLVSWFAIIFAMTTSGILARGNTAGIVLAIAVPLLAGVALLIVSPTFRQIIDAMPQHWLIGIQTLRVGGFVILVLVDMRLVPTAFGTQAGFGDVLVGILAPMVAYWYYLNKPFARGVAIGFAAIGFLDLINAGIQGLVLAPPGGFAPQIAPFFLLVPTYAVPLFILLHIYSLRGLLRRSTKVEVVENRRATMVIAG